MSRSMDIPIRVENVKLYIYIYILKYNYILKDICNFDTRFSRSRFLSESEVGDVLNIS